MDQLLNVFVVDRNGDALADARIKILYDKNEIAEGTTRGKNKPFSLQFPEEYDYLTVEAKYGDFVETRNVPKGTLSLEIRMKGVVPPTPDIPPSVPPWFPVAGYTAGLLTLIFLMAVTLLDAFGHQIQNHFLVILVAAFGLALAASFIGGDQAAKGNIPFFKDSPVAFSVTGGMAAFLITVLVGAKLYP